MTGFLISAIIVTVLIVFIWLSLEAIEGDKVATAAVCLMVFLVLGLVINHGIKTETKGPCHQYETRMMYNATTKTMMPSRVCVLRGEWVEDDR